MASTITTRVESEPSSDDYNKRLEDRIMRLEARVAALEARQEEEDEEEDSESDEGSSSFEGGSSQDEEVSSNSEGSDHNNDHVPKSVRKPGRATAAGMGPMYWPVTAKSESTDDYNKMLEDGDRLLEPWEVEAALGGPWVEDEEDCEGGDAMPVSADMAMARAHVYSDDKSGDDDDDDDDDGNKLLSLAKKGKHMNVKDLLERKPGLIRSKSSEGETVLHVAAAHGHVDTVKQLLRIISKKNKTTIIKAGDEHGAEEEAEEISNHHRGLIRAKTWSGDTALHLAARSGHVDTVKHLVHVISKEENKDADEKAAEGGTLLLLEKNKEGDTAVHVALKEGISEIAWYLIKKEPRVAYEVNNKGVSPLFLAVQGEHDDVVEDLFKLRPGKDVDESVKEKIIRPETPLAHEALRSGNLGTLFST